MSEEDNAIESQPSYGPVLRRQRFTGDMELFSLPYLLTDAQRQTFENFYRNTAKAGALPFDHTHPLKGTTVEMEFRHDSGPGYSREYVAPDRYLVTIQVRVLP
jgi:hypothetical protein